MSQNNREGQRTARDRLRAEQEREKATAKRFRTLKVGAVVVVVLAVAAGVGAMVSQRSGDETQAEAKPVTMGKAGAPAKLTVYEDFRCPACGQFEKQFHDTVNELENQGKVKTAYHLVSIIDDNMGGSGSQRAGNAALCARDEGAGKFRQLHDTLFRHQPLETQDTFANQSTLLKLGRQTGLDSARFRSCVQQGTHNKTVKASSAAFRNSGYTGTPTVLLDGKNIYGANNKLTPAKLKQLVAAKG